MNEKSPARMRKAFSVAGVGEISNFDLVKELVEVVDYVLDNDIF